MKKLLAGLFVLTFVSGMLFSGGQTEESSGSEEVTEIVYWQYFYETKKTTIDELISMFEAENPDIKVVHQTFPYEQYGTKVAASVPSGSGPNVINLYYGWLPTYIDSDYLQPLPNDRFNPSDIESEFFDLVKAAKVDGSYYALPTAVRSLALFWNKDLFSEAGLDPETPPVTVEEMLSMAADIVKMDGSGNYEQTGLTQELRGQVHHYLREVLIRQFGGQPYSADGKTVTYNNQAGYDAFKFLVEMQTERQLGMPQFMTDDVTAFKSGKMGMTIDGSFRLGTLDKIEELNYGVAELPSLNGVHNNFASFWAHGITKFTSGKELEASMKFLEYITSEKAMEMWLENIGELPARKTLANKPEYANHPKYGAFIRGLEYANATNFIEEKGQRQVWIDAYDNVLLKNMSIEEAVDIAAEQEQAILDKYYNNK